MTKEQREQAEHHAGALAAWAVEDYCETVTIARARAGSIAALLRAGIAASEECERLRSLVAARNLEAALLNMDVKYGWLAAWDAEWRAQEANKAHRWMMGWGREGR